MRIYKPVGILLLLFFSQFETVKKAAAAESDLLNILLSRPAASSITISLLPHRSLSLYCEYHKTSDSILHNTPIQEVGAGRSATIVLTDLIADTPYTYRLRYRESSATAYIAGEEHFFHTQRARGSAFTFTVEADPHLYDKKGCSNLMRIALQNQAQDFPDFMLDLGDTFGDDHNPFTITQPEIEQLHTEMRGFFGAVCHSIPFLFCIGNHEGEFGYYLQQMPPENIAVYATLARKTWFPNPVPDDFYSGNTQSESYNIGLPENYYAFEWGDALLVVLDAYRYFSGNAKPRNWEWTLGQEQYTWFKQTLETSSAPYKFVFIHHILGQTRGGVAVADGYEWGGYNQKGVWEFDQMRPEWPLPIHQLMVKNGVQIFFQGHDHLYAREELDGIVYQEVPMPSDSTYIIGTTDNGGAYNGVKLDASGHLRVTVTPNRATIDYVRAWLPQDETGGHRNGEVSFSYAVLPAGGDTTAVSDSVFFFGQELLGRPTATSVTLNLCADRPIEAFIEYGTAPLAYSQKTEPRQYPGKIPFTIVLEDLQPATWYKYRLHCRPANSAAGFSARAEHTFTTQRAKGAAFSFAIEADPHLDANTDPELYKRTLQNILASGCDFLIDLGDNFMSEKEPLITPESVLQRHLLLRGYYDLAGHSLPLFLALGNHEGELGFLLDGSDNCLPVWATNIRKQFYPNPIPDGFYSGNTTAEPYVGLRENYYAWEWGDALFVVLDPYWYTTQRQGDNWRFTLGKVQYDWFKSTLESSQAEFKFVFCHQILGGKDSQARGGSDYAGFYEMGGMNADSTWGFSAHRPDWEMPLHQLMVANHVSVFFHGHDHFYARQEKDGLIYQLVPQPGYPGTKSTAKAAEWGYQSGDILPSSGFLRVTVAPETTTVDYIRSLLPAQETAQARNGMIEYAYTLRAGSTTTAAHHSLPPGLFSLEQNYPNPFNPQTSITFTLAASGRVRLEILNTAGQCIQVMIDEQKPAGRYTLSFDASQLAGGLYFSRLTVAGGSITKKMICLH
jgi:phosphodiesterase/alkaline phosphatase D-like protein